MKKAPTPTEQSKKQCDNTKKTPKNFDYTTIMGRLMTISRSNDTHQTGVVLPVYRIPIFPIIAKTVQSKGHTLKHL